MEILNNRYIAYFMLSPYYSLQYGKIMSQTTRNFVPITAQYKLFLAIPHPMEQQEIVRQVEALFKQADEIEKQVATATQSAERITQSILAKAFRGELVPQDPNDEPASVLLEKIKAE